MLVPVTRVGRGPAADFTVLASLVGGLLVWLVLASYALGRSQRRAVLHLQDDVARYATTVLAGPGPHGATNEPALDSLLQRAGLRAVRASTPQGGAVIERISDAPGMDMAPGRPALLQAFVSLALAATCILGAWLLVRLHRQHEETAARTDFVRVVSHELRTPLSQILMFAETLRLGRTRSDAERTFALDVILQEARRLARLVDNVLRFTRLEQGALALQQEPLDVAAEVRETAAQFAPAGDADGARVTVQASTAVYAFADRDALRQVLVNLLDNALKHGERRAPVHALVTRTADGVEVAIEDEGPGVHDADRDTIWQAFGRGRTRVRDDGGTGLGLTIVRGLVLGMGGAVRCEARANGTGARFVVMLRAAGDPTPRPGVLVPAERPA